jgi:signal transduction histidine kinase
LFFLYLLPFWFSILPADAQAPDREIDQDSLNYYMQIVAQGEQQVGRALAGIGFLYQRAERYNSAIGYFNRALTLLNHQPATLEVARIHAALGSIYELFGDNAEPGRYYALARNEYLKSSNLIEELGDNSMQMSIHQHLADIATKRGNFRRALTYQSQIIKSLTQLYNDSLQRQSESFNELLNNEIASSKDTIYVEVEGDWRQVSRSVPLADWRHFAILILALALAMNWWKWRNQQNTIRNLQEEIINVRKIRQDLEQQKDELQHLNLKLTQTEKEQRKSSQAKDKIFSIIAHDLRSPVNSITGLLNLLSTKMPSIGDIELRNLVRDVSKATDRLVNFLDDLLKWSMSQMGRLEPEIEKVDFKKIVQENYDLAKPRLKKKNIHFRATVPEGVDVYADSNMLRLILRNLISNSIKFTRQDGYIAVSLKPGGPGFSMIQVSDDGIGMSEEKLQGLFEFQGSGINGGAENEGTGLGLLLCKEFVELNGGEIEVTSRLGEGTSFSIRLPNHPTENEIIQTD